MSYPSLCHFLHIALNVIIIYGAYSSHDYQANMRVKNKFSDLSYSNYRTKVKCILHTIFLLSALNGTGASHFNKKNKKVFNF